ncbi:MAG: hypothetical protein AB7O68_24425 [Pirellulales bacterium]
MASFAWRTGVGVSSGAPTNATWWSLAAGFPAYNWLMSEDPLGRDAQLSAFRRRYQVLKFAFEVIQDAKASRNYVHKLIANTNQYLDLQRECRRAGFTDGQISN